MQPLHTAKGQDNYWTERQVCISMIILSPSTYEQQASNNNWNQLNSEAQAFCLSERPRIWCTGLIHNSISWNLCESIQPNRLLSSLKSWNLCESIQPNRLLSSLKYKCNFHALIKYLNDSQDFILTSWLWGCHILSKGIAYLNLCCFIENPATHNQTKQRLPRFSPQQTAVAAMLQSRD